MILITCRTTAKEKSRHLVGDFHVNMIIANNIQAELKKKNKKHVDLVKEVGVSKQTMSKIMNDARAINTIELHIPKGFVGTELLESGYSALAEYSCLNSIFWFSNVSISYASFLVLSYYTRERKVKRC